MNKKTLTIKEAAAVIGISPQRMYELSHQENFYPLLQIGRKRLVLTHLLDQWMNEQSGQRED